MSHADEKGGARVELRTAIVEMTRGGEGEGERGDGMG